MGLVFAIWIVCSLILIGWVSANGSSTDLIHSDPPHGPFVCCLLGLTLCLFCTHRRRILNFVHQKPWLVAIYANGFFLTHMTFTFYWTRTWTLLAFHGLCLGIISEILLIQNHLRNGIGKQDGRRLEFRSCRKGWCCAKRSRRSPRKSFSLFHPFLCFSQNTLRVFCFIFPFLSSFVRSFSFPPVRHPPSPCPADGMNLFKMVEKVRSKYRGKKEDRGEGLLKRNPKRKAESQNDDLFFRANKRSCNYSLLSDFKPPPLPPSAPHPSAPSIPLDLYNLFYNCYNFRDLMILMEEAGEFDDLQENETFDVQPPNPAAAWNGIEKYSGDGFEKLSVPLPAELLHFSEQKSSKVESDPSIPSAPPIPPELYSLFYGDQEVEKKSSEYGDNTSIEYSLSNQSNIIVLGCQNLHLNGATVGVVDEFDLILQNMKKLSLEERPTREFDQDMETVDLGPLDPSIQVI